MGFFSTGPTRNKLLLLYLLDSLSMGPTLEQLVRINSEQSFMNYFDLQQTLGDLFDSGLLEKAQTPLGSSALITQSGRDTLAQFESRLPESERESLKAFARANREALKRDGLHRASYVKEAPMEYRVTFEAFEHDEPLMEMKLLVTSRAAAEHMCARWAARAGDVYKSVMTILSSE